MKSPHASSVIMKIEYKSPPRLILISPNERQPLSHHQD